MSVYQQSIQAFIDVLESGLISTPDWADLSKRASNMSEDDEDIYEEIDQWLQLESRSQIREAYIKRLKTLAASSPIANNDNLGIAKSKSPTPPNQPKPSSKQLLINVIQKNSPLSDSATAKPENKANQ